MAQHSFCLVGFGNVGQAFARLLICKRQALKAKYEISFNVTGIATGRHGMAIDPAGIDLEEALRIAGEGGRMDALAARPLPGSVLEFIRACPADVLFENSPVNHQTGQPAVDHLRAGLEQGMHAITANKGPVVHGYRELTELAAQQGKRFLFELSVMDGAPIFSLFRGALPAVELQGFRGILNSCTNLLLERMEGGETLEQAVAYGTSIGITETDPSADIDGWDAAIKVAALATVLMGVPLKPEQVDRQGIRAITPEMIREALAAGERWKLVCAARRDGDGEAAGAGVVAWVAPERVSKLSPLYSVGGTSSFVTFELDTLPGLGILESNPGPETTAYGLLADLINAVRGQ